MTPVAQAIENYGTKNKKQKKLEEIKKKKQKNYKLRYVFERKDVTARWLTYYEKLITLYRRVFLLALKKLRQNRMKIRVTKIHTIVFPLLF